MSNEPRYHAVRNEIFYKGIKRVKCFGESANSEQNESESVVLAEEIAKHLNKWPETLDSFGKERR